MQDPPVTQRADEAAVGRPGRHRVRAGRPHVGRPHPVRWIRAHPVAADALFASLLTAISLAFHLFDSSGDVESIRVSASDVAAGVDGGGDAAWVVMVDSVTRPSWWTVPLVVLAVLPIAVRRVRPVAAVVVVTASQVAASLADVFGPEFIGVVIALYSLGAHATGRRRTRAVSFVGAIVTLLFVAGLIVDEVTVGMLLSTTILLVTAFVLGDNLRRRREAADDLQERLERAERERELLARERVGAERSRIARELHDIVAHSVSAMVIQAGAARRNLHGAPERADVALGNIEQVGREAMAELRSVLGVLRRSEAEQRSEEPSGTSTLPQPTLGDVAQLIATATDLPVSSTIAGPWHDLASSTDLTGYRIVQEALTNVRRHAGPVTDVRVMVRREERAIVIEVVDDGRGAAADDRGPGYGVLGMRERLAAVGGSLAAGPRSGGGWKVTATLPCPPLDEFASVEVRGG